MSEIPYMPDTHLWAVGIQGPDDLIPVADYPTAMRLANSFNNWWQAHIERRGGLHEFDPHMWAAPVIYTGSAEQHADDVANPSEDYVAFLLDTSEPAHPRPTEPAEQGEA